MNALNYQRFSAIPEGVTNARWDGDVCLNKDHPMKWGGKIAPPAIGTRVVVNFNRLGEGTVKGYFVEGGWFGLLVHLKDPPDWWKKQNGHRKGSDRWAHIFGPEFEGGAR